MIRGELHTALPATIPSGGFSVNSIRLKSKTIMKKNEYYVAF